MNELEAIREKIERCDDKIVDALSERMRNIEAIIAVKKREGLPILQPKQEAKQFVRLKNSLKENPYQAEIEAIFSEIVKNSKKVQAKSLFQTNIMLIGFMGAGKSTIADFLSEMLAMKKIEMDACIVEKEGRSISEIFEVYGEAYFRNCESNLLMEVAKQQQLVVSCGGGVVLRDENIQVMKKNGTIILLTAKPETIYERVKDSTERPLLNDNMTVPFIAEMLEKRYKRYEAAADVIVATDDKNQIDICEELIKALVKKV